MNIKKNTKKHKENMTTAMCAFSRFPEELRKEITDSGAKS